MMPGVMPNSADIQSLVQARHAQPHAFLGMHARRGGMTVRAFLKDATACDLVEPDAQENPPVPMKRIAREGLYEVFLPGRPSAFKYQLRAAYPGGVIRQFHDPYCFLPTLSEQDLYLFNEGTELRVYEKLGAHVRDLGGVTGVSFAVWAPSAARVSVVGNFNAWDGRYHPMRSMGASGVWELFVPGLHEGELYKFEIRDREGGIRLKTDPYGTYFEAPPGNAAIVCDTRGFAWSDAG
ncbi:MAG: GlgB N-terminal domain-containing protein, partial [Opitutaceae bacterium]